MIDMVKLQFMKTYAEIRQVQPTDSNRNPVFWLIQTQVDESCTGDEGPDNTAIHIEGKYIETTDGSDENYEDVRDKLISDITNNFEPDAYADNDDAKELRTRLCQVKSVQDIEDALETYQNVSDAMSYSIDISYTKKVYRTVYDHMFLTKQAAKEHIEKYNYRYANPRTYANTCLDSPYMERFFRIIDDPSFWENIIKMAEEQEKQKGKTL